MSIKYKFNILDALKDAGYSTFRLRKEKILSEGTIQRLRENKVIAIESIDTICGLLDIQPGDMIKHTKEDA